MKWLNIIVKVIDILKWLIPGNSGLGADVAVLKETIGVLTKDMPSSAKGDAFLKAVGNLEAVKGLKKRSVKKLNKFKDRVFAKYL